MSAEGRHANAAPCEVQMDGCTFGRDDQASSSWRRRTRNGVSGAARKATNGVAKGANTPLAVEKQSGDRSGDRAAITGCGADARGLGGEERRRAAQFVDRIRSAPWHVTFRVMCQAMRIACLLERTGFACRRGKRTPRLESRGSSSYITFSFTTVQALNFILRG